MRLAKKCRCFVILQASTRMVALAGVALQHLPKRRQHAGKVGMAFPRRLFGCYE
jgi:hypothetical protein